MSKKSRSDKSNGIMIAKSVAIWIGLPKMNCTSFSSSRVAALPAKAVSGPSQGRLQPSRAWPFAEKEEQEKFSPV